MTWFFTASDEVYVTDTWAHEVYRFDSTKNTFTPLSFHRPVLLSKWHRVVR